ncbi:hypothetical protein E3P81_00876 [Wallemia ichthyophaga]|nr:hypothetical protein E3P97_00877 [Wallemia ichthyophaga]TIA94914.1 hypothetical protein E3P96_03976 [Wallemia ichthyophaga]TIB34754.1 hypothetical protein E3P85_00731 [Wallemia ichthyophaga]TIB49362.1 hypothetical protein E3P82_00874 [Wallemia ichthyophaga]TIB53254.1 hypothetical protein E3P81_00876 [Wallemia ichthyophaga]
MALVFGSINVDEFLAVPHIVRPGETISSTHITKKAGGKGANVAVALAKASARVLLAGQIGEDGEWVRALLNTYCVDTTHLLTTASVPSGRATIQISQEGENSIVLYGGSNQMAYGPPLPLSPATISHLLVQEEIVHADTTSAIVQAHNNNIKTVYNPSPLPPSHQLLEFPWHALSYLILNQGEAMDLYNSLVGQGQHAQHAHSHSQQSPQHLLDALTTHPLTASIEGVIITLGSEGLVARVKIDNTPHDYCLPSTKVNAIDTTGAGDTFAGYFVAACMSSSMSTHKSTHIELVLKNAMAAAALAVTKPGAMDAIPILSQVRAHLLTNDIECVL